MGGSVIWDHASANTVGLSHERVGRSMVGGMPSPVNDPDMSHHSFLFRLNFLSNNYISAKARTSATLAWRTSSRFY